MFGADEGKSYGVPLRSDSQMARNREAFIYFRYDIDAGERL